MVGKVGLSGEEEGGGGGVNTACLSGVRRL